MQRSGNRNNKKRDLAASTVDKVKISSDQLVDAIRNRAEEIAALREDSFGDPIDDWLRAEKEMKLKYGMQ